MGPHRVIRELKNFRLRDGQTPHARFRRFGAEGQLPLAFRVFFVFRVVPGTENEKSSVQNMGILRKRLLPPFPEQKIRLK